MAWPVGLSGVCARWAVAGLMRAARAAVLGAIVAGAAQPAFAEYFIGYQMVVDFEELAAGDSALHYDGEDTFISGGVVTAGGPFAPLSGLNTYVGTSIVTKQSADGSGGSGVDLWPALAAWVSPGAAAVTVKFFGWSPDDQMLVEMASFQTVGTDAHQYFRFDAPYSTPLSLVSMSFTSTEAFAVDDLTFGLPDVVPGVPEPSAWALAILGFGAAGAMLRRRRALTA